MGTVPLSVAPSLHPSLPPSSSDWPGFPPPLSLFLLSYCRFLKHQQCLFHRRTFCRGRGRYPVAAPAPSVECGEVPGGRPRAFCGGQWREGGMQGGSNGRGNCDSKFVLVAAPFTNPKGHIFVPWGLRVGMRPAQTCCHNIPFHCSLPPSLRPHTHPPLATNHNPPPPPI